MSTTDTPTFNPDCTVCHGTGFDDAFGTTCTECWGFVPRRGNWSGQGPSIRQRAAERSDASVARSTVTEDEAWKTQPRWVKEGSQFLVVIPKNLRSKTGDTVDVRSRNGVKAVQLGRLVRTDKWGSCLYLPVDDRPKQQSPAKSHRDDVDPGFYQLDGTVYRVQLARTSGRPYAKALTEHGDWEYASGVQFKLTPEHRLTTEQAAAYGKRTGQCIFCRRELTDPESIERGIGPICLAKYC